MSVIKGENAILYWKVDGVFLPVACMEAWALSTDTELSETSTVQTGIYRTYRGNRHTWHVNCNGVCSFDTNHSVVKMRLLQQPFSVIPIAIVETDDNGIGSTFTGNVIIINVTNDAAATDFDNYSIEAVGIGEYFITDIPIDPNECCQDAWKYYTANGTEGVSITISALIGRTIAGRLYRDGIEYRPSGVDHDGLGIPVGKQFKFEIATGKISFDGNIIPLGLGEQVDIPFNFCGGGSLTCDIMIDNVMVTVEEGQFNITFEPVVDGAITIPDNVTVRYSTDGGETWQIPDSVTYDPETNYGLVIINDDLATDEAYLFELTPVCNDIDGTAGTGTYYPCIPVTFTAGTPELPDATVGQIYQPQYALSGSAPFVLTVNDKPDWLTISIDGNVLEFFGTPTEAATDEVIDIDIANCVSDILHFADIIDSIEVLTPSIILGGAICRSEGTCNDNGICGVNFTVNTTNAPAGSYIDVNGIFGPATITVTDSDPGSGKINYVEPSGIGSTNFNLLLKDSGGAIIATQATTITHQSFWPFLGTCP